MSTTINREQGGYIKAEFISYMLMFIAGLAAEDRFDDLLKLGVRKDQIDNLLQMSAHEIHAAAKRSHALFFNIQVDDEALDASLNIAHRQVDEYQKIDRMIKAGAGYPTLNRLYGLDRETVAKRRCKMNLLGARNGRPTVATLEQRLDIIEQLEKMGSVQCNETEVLLGVSQTINIPIDSVWPVYQEWKGHESVAIDNKVAA